MGRTERTFRALPPQALVVNDVFGPANAPVRRERGGWGAAEAEGDGWWSEGGVVGG